MELGTWVWDGKGEAPGLGVCVCVCVCVPVGVTQFLLPKAQVWEPGPPRGALRALRFASLSL